MSRREKEQDEGLSFGFGVFLGFLSRLCRFPSFSFLLLFFSKCFCFIEFISFYFQLL